MEFTRFSCVALLLGCSASQPISGPRDSPPMTNAGAGNGAAKSGAGNGSAGALDLSNSVGLITTSSSGSGAGTGGTGGAGGDLGIPAGCEPGKFCKPTVPDPTNCGTLSLKQDIEVKRVPGNLLVLFDQSLSMGEPWGNTGQSKLVAAQMAIANAINSLQDSLSVGALFFPTYICLPGINLGPDPTMSGGAGGANGAGGAAAPAIGIAVAPIDGEGQIPFQPGPQFLMSWQTHWANAAMTLPIGTPLQEAFDRADAAINSSKLMGALAVVAVTDGEPNCIPDAAAVTDLEVNRAKHWFDTKMIKTYVVGLPGANGVQLLNNIAMSGGTMQYLLPDDPKMLEAKLKEVVQETIRSKFASCSINLTPAADPADKLLMIVVDSKTSDKRQVPHMINGADAWTITPDGTHVEITGAVCDDAMSGRFTSITFEYPCKEVPPPPPIIIDLK